MWCHYSSNKKLRVLFSCFVSLYTLSLPVHEFCAEHKPFYDHFLFIVSRMSSVFNIPWCYFVHLRYALQHSLKLSSITCIAVFFNFVIFEKLIKISWLHPAQTFCVSVVLNICFSHKQILTHTKITTVLHIYLQESIKLWTLSGFFLDKIHSPHQNMWGHKKSECLRHIYEQTVP